MNRMDTLAVAARMVGLTRGAIYRVAISQRRIPAELVRARKNGRTRPRWLVDLRAVKEYFGGSTVLRDNRTKAKPAK